MEPNTEPTPVEETTEQVVPVAKLEKRKKPEPAPELTPEGLEEIVDTETDFAEIDFANTSGEIKIGDEVRLTVKSLVFGKLFIKLRDGGTYEFNRAGTTHEMTMKELRELKSTQLTFFKNQWLLIMGISPSDTTACNATPADVYRSLGVAKFFQNYIDPTSFRYVCALKPNEIETRTKILTPQAKGNLIVALRGYIEKGVMRDLKLIEAWEEHLGTELLSKR